jgi:tetratricopeptide (TPR) repeat protein
MNHATGLPVLSLLSAKCSVWRDSYSVPWRAAWLLAFVFCTFTTGAQPIFWETELTRALDLRDSSYRIAAGIDTALFAAMRQGSRHVVPNVSFQDTASPWFYFLSGMAARKDSSDAVSRMFTKAVATTGKDPGQTFALALEFGRCGQAIWEEKCLKKLNVLFLVSGAQSAPLISQMLLYNASRSPAGSDQAVRSRFWAAIFDRHCLWPFILDIKDQGVFAVPKASSLAKEIISRIKTSWELQLELSRQWYRWFVHVCMVLVFCVLVGISAKYLPLALHLFSERLSDAYRPKAKLALTLVLYFSLLFLGIIPFLWITFFLLWRHLRMRDKMLAGVALVLILLYPISIRLTDMFESCCTPKSSVTLLRKAIDEGYYTSLDSSIATRLKTAGNDYLAQSASAILNLKKGDAAAAALHVRVARQLSPLDPSVIVTAGNSLYFAGDLAGARNAFLECIKLYPSYEPPYFNLGQYYFNSMETAKGMEFITQAAKLNPAFINAFIKTNDDLFSKDWPLVRQLIQPDYAPSYFWKNIFPRYGGSWVSANNRFGADCLGMSILAYGGTSLFLLILLMALDTLIWSKDTVRKIYVCKLCQTPICRKCKRGGICQDCFNSTQHIRNENIRQRIMAKIQFRSRRFHVLIATFLDMAVPGAGMLYSNTSLYWTLPVLIVTAVVYGSYLIVLYPSTTCPAWLMHSLVMPGLAVCIAYNAFFIVRTLIQVIRELKLRGE